MMTVKITGEVPLPALEPALIAKIETSEVDAFQAQPGDDAVKVRVPGPPVLETLPALEFRE